MPDQYTRNKFMWLTLGVLAGTCVAYFWPHEPAYASTTNRESDFMVFTCQVDTSPNNIVSQAEAIFVLDFVTGQLRGALMNNKTGKFTNFYQRNVAEDFDVEPGTEPHYAVVAGQANLPSKGRYTTAAGIVYIAELNSGLCIGYAFQYRDSQTAIPVFELAPADQFRWRDTL